MRDSVLLFGVIAAVAGGIAAFMGCGGGDNKATPGDDAGDAAAEAADEPPPADAGPDREQDPNVYPAKHQPIPQLDNHGGPVLDHVKIVTVTFAGDANAAAFGSFDRFIVTSGWWGLTAGGYNIQNGTNGGEVSLPDTVTGKSISDDDVQAFVQANVVSGTFPKPDAQTLYIIFYPSTTTTITGPGGIGASCLNFGGYHSSAVTQVDGGTSTPVAYAVIPRCNPYGDKVKDFNYLTIVASHEIAEAATDPQVLSMPTYFNSSDDSWNPGNGVSTLYSECGDMCEYLPDSYDESGYSVQRIWSNAAAAASKHPCQPAPMGKLFYGAAVRTNQMQVNGHNSYGYVVVSKGSSVDALVDVFSEAPLPHDLSFYIGKDKGAADPTNLAPIDDGITAQLSLVSGHNGNAATLTITVPKSATPGDYKFLVRSVLEQGDYNDWPVIAHIP